MKTIEIVIDANGEVVVETKGYRGKECKAASKPFEDALGTVTKDDDTPEARLAPARQTVKQ